MILLSRFLISIAELYLIMEPRLSPYEILQISEQSSADEIRERYLVMSRTFHPDKQPLENWNITKKYFESIDKAYKSISTELRKYIYFKFGVDGIDLLERYPDEFATLEGKENTPEGKQVKVKVFSKSTRWSSTSTFQTDETTWTIREKCSQPPS